MASDIKGTVTRVIGPVVDCAFPDGKLPEIYDAVFIATEEGGELVCEVAATPRRQCGTHRIHGFHRRPAPRHGSHLAGRTHHRTRRTRYAGAAFSM